MIDAVQQQIQSEFDDDYERGLAWRWTEAERYREKVIEVDLQRVLTASAEDGLRCRTLVLLCGFATAPLLLSASSARPSEILLVRSMSMDDGAVADIRTHIEALKEQRFNNGPYLDGGATIDVVEIDDTDVARAFRTLVERLSGYAGRGGVIVDVTGGKKTMVGSAFLACSHLGIPAQYVDFERYHSGAQQPYPGTAVLRRLRDPAGVLRLKQRERARRAFEEERFDDAAREIGDILEALTGAVADGYVLAEEAAALEANRRVAEAAALQAEGRHDEVLRFSESHSLSRPPAAAALGPTWDSYKGSQTKLNARYDALVSNPELLAWYIGDELWRRWREVARGAGDYRFPFLRAYAVVELMLVAALFPQRLCLLRNGERVDSEPRASRFAHRLPSACMAGVLAEGWWVANGLTDREKAFANAGREPVWELRDARLFPAAKSVARFSKVRNACAHSFGIVEDEHIRELLEPLRGAAWQMAEELFRDHLGEGELFEEIVARKGLHDPPKWQ